MEHRIQAIPENTTIGDYLQKIYKNFNGVKQGPFYYRITGMNANSWKIISVNAFGDEMDTPNKIIQIKQNGDEHIVPVTNVHFGSRRDKPNYISWKYTPF